MLLMRKRILVDLVHGNLFLSNKDSKNDWEKFNELKRLFNKLDFEVKEIKDFNSQTITLENGEILILGGPQELYTREEIDLIHKYVNNSGSLFVMHNYGGDERNKTNLNEVMKEYGIKFKSNLIHDEAHNVRGFIHGPIITDFEENSIFFNVKEFSLILGCSLHVEKPASIIARSDKNSYTKDYSAGDVWVNEKISVKTVAAVVDEENTGRILAIGDLHLFSDDDGGLKVLENAKLLENIFEWLSEPFISIQSNLIRVNRKLTLLSHDINFVKKQIGLMDAPSVKSPGTSRLYTPDELALKVKRIETDLAKDAEKTRKEEVEYFHKRVRYELIALIIGLASIAISIILILITFLR